MERLLPRFIVCGLLGGRERERRQSGTEGFVAFCLLGFDAQDLERERGSQSRIDKSTRSSLIGYYTLVEKRRAPARVSRGVNRPGVCEEGVGETEKTFIVVI